MTQYKTVVVCALLVLSACAPLKIEILATNTPEAEATIVQNTPETSEVIMDIMKKPLIPDMYTADPSAHVFDGKLYIYPSHDLDHDNPATNDGDQFDMEDYHVFSMDDMQSLPVDHGEVLHVKDVP